MHANRITRHLTFSMAMVALLITQTQVAPLTRAATPIEEASAVVAVRRPPLARMVLPEGAPPKLSAEDATQLHWNPLSEFLASPSDTNPAPDGYGNPDVWSYLAGPSLDHDPGSYVPMPQFTKGDGRQTWRYPYDMYLQISFVGTIPELQMHTGAGWLTVLGWRSPMEGSVLVEGNVHNLGGDCTNVATGIIFSVDQGSHIVQRIVMNRPGQQLFRMQLSVAVGESLYFVLDPGIDTNCDTTLLTLNMTGTPTVPNTAMSAS